MNPPRIVVIGGGITGLSAAHTLLTRAYGSVAVTVLEADDRVGGVIRTSPFASLPDVDEGADAFLTRVPWARELAVEVGLDDQLTSPRNVGAYVWRGGLHSIPDDLLLGVPASARSFATTKLLSPRGKARAAMEPFLPRRDTSHDCLGRVVRERFGNEVLEYLVDPLVGSIYAADTDSFSLEAVPQINALAGERSLLVAAQRVRSTNRPGGPVFATPRHGMGALVDAVRRSVLAKGGEVLKHHRAESIEKHATGTYVVHTKDTAIDADAIIVAAPARAIAPIFRDISADVSDKLARWSHASVAMLTMAVPREQWPSHLTGSGYLVPKPEQRWVTATSFGSNKWAHWNPDDRSMILRVSLGRDGSDVMHFDDDSLVNLALADLAHHLDANIEPSDVRISRWPSSFPQYRPHHFALLADIELRLSEAAPRIQLAGASYRGIGVPACIQQARGAAETVLTLLGSLPQ